MGKNNTKQCFLWTKASWFSVDLFCNTIHCRHFHGRPVIPFHMFSGFHPLCQYLHFLPIHPLHPLSLLFPNIHWSHMSSPSSHIPCFLVGISLHLIKKAYQLLYIWSNQSKPTQLLEETNLAFYPLSSYWFSQTSKQFFVLSHIPLHQMWFNLTRSSKLLLLMRYRSRMLTDRGNPKCLISLEKKAENQDGSKSKSLPCHMPFAIHQ